MTSALYLKKFKESDKEKFYEIFYSFLSKQKPLYIKVNQRDKTIVFSVDKEFIVVTLPITLTKESALPAVFDIDKRVTNKIIFLIYNALKNEHFPDLIEYAS